ncbi:hypothetical protein KV205_07720 [Streptomyces sp. SKN60]|uniref:hypothetical protein n=1 Tax=Streptomyces sp. SKN60 TaxID=2855506 RepID=UPI00224533DD|nr:hypothetical protein [Streptomyces sp. SKN60]MCX2180416.1 hypothetical protein [Streptomyces sp. SKN60]
MPVDPFAVLNALLRAEAARNRTPEPPAPEPAPTPEPVRAEPTPRREARPE